MPGAGGGIRTHTPQGATDFESVAYANSATPAWAAKGREDNKSAGAVRPVPGVPSAEAANCGELDRRLTIFLGGGSFGLPRGAVAQLGEHQAGSLRVGGSIPPSSTNFLESRRGVPRRDFLLRSVASTAGAAGVPSDAAKSRNERSVSSFGMKWE